MKLTNYFFNILQVLFTNGTLVLHHYLQVTDSSFANILSVAFSRSYGRLAKLEQLSVTSEHH